MLAMKMIKMMIEVIWILFNRKGKNNAFLIVFMACTFSFVEDDNDLEETNDDAFQSEGKKMLFLWFL